MKHLLPVLCLFLALVPGVPGVAQPPEVPLEFRFVGNYQLEKRVKLKDGRPFRVAMAPTTFRVYTDGISVRLYGEDEAEGYTEFSIYRNDGVVVRTSQTSMETVAGLQARCTVGNVLRQLTLTQRRLTLTKFPALSDLVQVTYAKREGIEGLSTVENQRQERP